MDFGLRGLPLEAVSMKPHQSIRTVEYAYNWMFAIIISMQYHLEAYL